jgi:hypothetical protein
VNPSNIGLQQFKSGLFAHRQINSALVVLISAFTALACLAAAAQASAIRPDAKEAEVDAYESAFNVPAATADRHLEVQARASRADLVGELKDRLGNAYAGVWFDPESGEFVVPAVAGSARTGIQSELSAAQLAQDFRSPTVAHTWRDLEEAQARIDAGWEKLVKSGMLRSQTMRTSLDPVANSVVVEAASDLASSEQAAIKSLTEDVEVPVELRTVDASQLQVGPAGCLEQYRLCDLPLRGGVVIYPVEGNLACSAGFSARSPLTSRRYLLTAGHCVATPTWQWRTFDTGPNEGFIGTTEQWQFPGKGDWAKIDATGTWADISPWPTQVAFWGQNHNYPIYGETTSYLNQVVCHAGANTGGSCAKVTELNQTVEYSEDEVIHGLTVATGPELCVGGGDSGGSVFSSNMAVGLLSGGGQWTTCSGEPGKAPQEMLYQEINWATAALGVKIEPTITLSPPTAETLPASEIQEDKATLNGAINPMGSQTAYYFEYGTTTAYGSKVPVPSKGVGFGSQPVNVSATATLLPRTRYHYRVVASNPGGTTYGADRAFTTGLKWNARNSNASGAPDISFWFGLPGEKRVVGDWNGDGKSTPGVYDQSTGVWKLRNSNSTGPADITFQYGGPSWTPVVGDWDGNGTTTVGVYDQAIGTWRLKNSNTPGGWDLEFGWGGSVWRPVVGDWNGDGKTTIGGYEPSVGTWRLKNTNSSGGWDMEFGWGGSVWTAVVGDWNGDGKTTVGLYEPSVGTWRIRNTNAAGGWDAEFQYGGGATWSSVVGDWDGNGTDTIGATNADYSGEFTWNLRNSNSSGAPDSSFWFGLHGEKRVVGDWNGDGKSTPGVYDQSTGVWKLRNSNSTGPADITFQYGGPSWTPVVGDWDGNGTTTVGVYDQAIGTWRLKNSNTPGGWDLEFGWGGSVWRPVVGDWNGDGKTTIGGYEPSVGTWRLKNTNSSGGWDMEFGWGGSVWTAVVGDWNGDGKTTVGLYEPSVGTWRIKNTNAAGGWDAEFQYGGGATWSSVVGDWDGNGTDTIGVQGY